MCYHHKPRPPFLLFIRFALQGCRSGIVRPSTLQRGHAQQVVCASNAKFFVGGNWKANGSMSMVDKLCQVGGRELGREGLVTKLG
jgi:hypothetical protein